MDNKNLHINNKLLLQLQKGDEKAFSIVFDTYHKYLYVIACRYLMSEEYAEDAVQHTFMRLWEGKEKFDYSKGIKNLLFTILKNYVLNEVRHRKMALEKNYEMAQMKEESKMDLANEIENEDFQTHLYRLIDHLPPQKREVCLLKLEKEMSNQEIAEKMNIAIPTVKSHYTQVVKFLRKNIDRITVLVWLLKHNASNL